MKQMFKILTVLTILIVLIGCEAQKNDSLFVEFKGRKIDLNPYIEGFPYRGFTPFYEAGKLYYYHQDSTTMLKELDMSGKVDLRKGVAVSDIDLSKRNVWEIRYRKTDNYLYWIGDEKNDEVINLYCLNPATIKDGVSYEILFLILTPIFRKLKGTRKIS